MKAASARTLFMISKFDNFPVSNSIQMYDCFVQSIFLTSAVAWAFGTLSVFDSVHANFMIKVLCLPKKTRHFSVLAELGRPCSSCLAFTSRLFYFLKIYSLPKFGFLKKIVSDGSVRFTIFDEFRIELRARGLEYVFFSEQRSSMLDKLRVKTHIFKFCLKHHLLKSSSEDSFFSHETITVDPPRFLRVWTE